MDLNGFPILSLITFAPILGSVIILLMPGKYEKAIKWTALVVSLIPLALSVILWLNYDASVPGMQFVEEYRWFEAVNSRYRMGVDGVSVPMIFLTALLTPAAVLYSFGIKERVKAYFALFLMLEMGMFGVFVSLDFVIFYIFWEIGLVPMYFLIYVWGSANRRYAAFKFFIYTLSGSVLMLLAIQVMYLATGSFSITELAGNLQPFMGDRKVWFLDSGLARQLAFWAFFIAFAIKVPIWPFHTWLPDAHTEAPTAGSMLLAGVLLKLGCYGFLRIVLPIFPDMAQSNATILALLALGGIILGGLGAMAQTDFKRLVAYSSVNHMGFVVLSIATVASAGAALTDRVIAYNGAVLQMFNHGITAAAMFMLVGVVYDRAHTRNLEDFGGLGVVVPVYGGILLFSTLASLGLPGLNGFVSEFMVFRGAFPVFTAITVLATIGLVVTAAFLLWMIQRVLLGPLNKRWEKIPEISAREIVAIAPLMVLMLLIGVYPSWILTTINQTVLNLLG
jgi:NADH-quinone oxidoreductase subunit M